MTIVPTAETADCGLPKADCEMRICWGWSAADRRWADELLLCLTKHVTL